VNPLAPECHELLRALDRATARLAGISRHIAGEVEHALAERLHAIEALTEWIRAEQQASHPVSPEVVDHLTRNIETGARILVRLALDRDATRIDLMALSHELQMLRGLSGPTTAKPTTIDCQG
jgi:hypothetical protein